MITSVSSSSWLESVCAALVRAGVRRGVTNQRGGGARGEGAEERWLWVSARVWFVALVSVVLGGVHQHCVSGAQGGLWLEPKCAV